MPLRVVFMGTSDFAVPALRALAAINGVVIPVVYTQPPRKSGRGQKARASAVLTAAEELGLEVYCPISLKSDAEAIELAGWLPDLVLVASYGLILPETILAANVHGCVNIHASTLPRWRGASPIQQAILHDDKSTGVDFFVMEKGLDTGPILLRETLDIRQNDTALSLHDRLAQLAASMVPEFMTRFDKGELEPTPQSENGVTYAPKIEKSDGIIDWRNSAAQIERQIRAFDPWPGAWSNLNDERLRFCKARVAAGSGEPGRVVAAPLIVATGDGLLNVEIVQRAGRKALKTEDLLRGFEIPVGSRLGN